MLTNFNKTALQVNGVSINCRYGGTGPALLLLHGFPQTHLIWRKIANELAQRYTLVMPDLRGYGDSSKPHGNADHSNYSKRMMAQDMIEVMHALGHTSFYLCGHDRGGRVAHRLALDYPDAVKKLMLIDISPTRTMYEATNQQLATLYYHWFFLIQPEPLPETLIGNNAAYFLNYTLSGWGSNGASFIEAEAMAEYQHCFCTSEAIHSACEDYRAAATIDLEHDRDHDILKIQCPTHVVWGQHGVVAKLFQPLDDWRVKCANRITGTALPAGHFIPEQVPQLLLQEMMHFFVTVDA
ncbi:MAG: alpha/beta fold hydrolase [Burkholderiaceae bacterium]